MFIGNTRCCEWRLDLLCHYEGPVEGQLEYTVMGTKVEGSSQGELWTPGNAVTDLSLQKTALPQLGRGWWDRVESRGHIPGSEP